MGETTELLRNEKKEFDLVYATSSSTYKWQLNTVKQLRKIDDTYKGSVKQQTPKKKKEALPVYKRKKNFIVLKEADESLKKLRFAPIQKKEISQHRREGKNKRSNGEE